MKTKISKKMCHVAFMVFHRRHARKTEPADDQEYERSVNACWSAYNVGCSKYQQCTTSWCLTWIGDGQEESAVMHPCVLWSHKNSHTTVQHILLCWFQHCLYCSKHHKSGFKHGELKSTPANGTVHMTCIIHELVDHMSNSRRTRDGAPTQDSSCCTTQRPN